MTIAHLVPYCTSSVTNPIVQRNTHFRGGYNQLMTPHRTTLSQPFGALPTQPYITPIDESARESVLCRASWNNPKSLIPQHTVPPVYRNIFVLVSLPPKIGLFLISFLCLCPSPRRQSIVNLLAPMPQLLFLSSHNLILLWWIINPNPYHQQYRYETPTQTLHHLRRRPRDVIPCPNISILYAMASLLDSSIHTFLIILELTH